MVISMLKAEALAKQQAAWPSTISARRRLVTASRNGASRARLSTTDGCPRSPQEASGAIDEYRHAERIRTERAAIERLIQLGLEAAAGRGGRPARKAAR
jgi:hypothetical protein